QAEPTHGQDQGSDPAQSEIGQHHWVWLAAWEAWTALTDNRTTYKHGHSEPEIPNQNHGGFRKLLAQNSRNLAIQYT
ncbi:hypothetical protein, partial [Asticcacaulis benevestitus]